MRIIMKKFIRNFLLIVITLGVECYGYDVEDVNGRISEERRTQLSPLWRYVDNANESNGYNIEAIRSIFSGSIKPTTKEVVMVLEHAIDKGNNTLAGLLCRTQSQGGLVDDNHKALLLDLTFKVAERGHYKAYCFLTQVMGFDCKHILDWGNEGKRSIYDFVLQGERRYGNHFGGEYGLIKKDLDRHNVVPHRKFSSDEGCCLMQ
jgi:hypothetical protein